MTGRALYDIETFNGLESIAAKHRLHRTLAPLPPVCQSVGQPELINMPEKTVSEILFEQFCDENRIAWHRIPVAGPFPSKTPDYKIECAKNTVIAEVKEFAVSPEDRLLLERLRTQGTTGAFEPKLDQRVRNKVDDAMPQLRQLAKNLYPAIIVLYDNVTLLPLEGLEIRLAMYGQDSARLRLMRPVRQQTVICTS